MANFTKKMIKNPKLKLLFEKLVKMSNEDLELIELLAKRLEY